MTVDERDCIVCKVQRGEREPDSVEHITETFGGKETPLVKSNVTVDYIGEDGHWHQYPLCDKHQSMVDRGRKFLYPYGH